MIKGQNTPLTIVMNEAVTATKLHALLYGVGGELKHWDESSAQIEGNVIRLPLTEAETIQFKAGRASLEVKLLDTDGIVQFFDVFQLKIEDRKDEHVLGGGN